MWISLFPVLLRWILALPLLWVAWELSIHRQAEEIEPSSLVAGFAAGLLALGLVWKELFRLAIRPLVGLIDLVHSPGGRLEKPVLNLKLPAHYLNEGRYEEAMTEYRKILRHHPDEAEAYEKAIWLEARVFDSPGRARALLRRAKRRGVTLDPHVVQLLETLRSS